MIETPRGPRSLLYRITRFSSVPLVAVVVVMLLSPFGQGNPWVPMLLPAPAAPTLTLWQQGFAPAANQQQQPPAVPNQQDQQPPPRPTDPAVLAVLEANPTTPEAQLRAIITLINLKAPEQAAPLLEELVNAQLDDDTAFELHKKHGAAAMLKIGSSPELQPQGKQFADMMLATVDRVAHDPARLAAVASDLASGNSETRYRAMAELRHGESQSAAVLIGLLADDDRAAASGTPGDDVIENEVLQEALVALRSNAVAPLCGALDCPKPLVQVTAANALAKLHSGDSIKFLLPEGASADDAVRTATLKALKILTARDLSEQEIAQYLYAEAKAMYLGEPVWRNKGGAQTQLWFWSSEDQTVTLQTMTQRNASYSAAALLAEKLHEIAPEAEAATTLFVNATLQAMAATRGTETNLDEEDGPYARVRDLGVAPINAALTDALNESRPLAAWGAVNLLGDIGDERLLHLNGSDVAPLAAALANADPRVRYAAADAILRIQPTVSFPGSSFVVPTLGHFAATSGHDRLMICDTRLADAQQLAGLANFVGYKADTANYSRHLIEYALSSPDYQAILLDITLPNAAIDLVVQQLRKDPRTAALPIGFLAPANRLHEADNYVRRYDSSATFIRPYTEDVMLAQLDKLLATADIAPLTSAERLTLASSSLQWLSQLTDAEQPLFNPLPYAVAAQDSLYYPELAAAAIDFQAACGLPECQTALLDFASTGSLPGDLRRQAVDGFISSLERHGVLLTSKQIMTQYDRYNASATSSEENIAILGEILDAIEAAATTRNAGGN